MAERPWDRSFLMIKYIKKNKAFTLVELLAVIVILGLIMGISVYGIGNIINNSKKNSAELSAKAYIDALNKIIMNNMITSDKINAGNYSINTNGNIEDSNREYIIQVDKTRPADGTTKIDKNKVESATIVIDGYVITYNDGVYGESTKSNPSNYSQTGSRLFLFNKTPGILDNYRIYGNSVQSGTPSPDMPIEVVTLGEPKNLFSSTNWLSSKQISGSTGQINDSTTNFNVCADYIKAKSATAYIYSQDEEVENIYFFQYDSNKNYLNYISNDLGEFTTSSDCQYILVQIKKLVVVHSQLKPN